MYKKINVLTDANIEKANTIILFIDVYEYYM